MPENPVELSPVEKQRLDTEATRLVQFATAARDPRGGFGWLDDHGRLQADEPVHLWVTCRMTHTFALAALHGDAEATAFVDHGMRGVSTVLQDRSHGGWFSSTGPDGRGKEAYGHAFVVLAAASASRAGHPDGPALLADALHVVDEHFWDEVHGMVADVASEDWSFLDPYRGANANMHMVEALLAAAEVTADRLWLDRAMRILTRIVDGIARDSDWRLPEHFDEQWNPMRDYNIGEPGHRFRPYGVTIGHLLEWSRLTLHTRTALGESAPGWMLDAAVQLYGAGVARGWAVDGADGFVYTTDFADVPVVRERMHWVVAEAIAAAWALGRATGDRTYRDDFDRWWRYAERYLLDERDGSWRHELDEHNRPSRRVWSGKPDVYHAYQATVLPLLPEAASFVSAAGSGW